MQLKTSMAFLVMLISAFGLIIRTSHHCNWKVKAYGAQSMSCARMMRSSQDEMRVKRRGGTAGVLFMSEEGDVPLIEELVDTPMEELSEMNAINREIEEMKLPISKEVAASLGAFLGVLAFGLNNIDPGVNGAELLKIAERESLPVSTAACQNKPIVIDFYAPWCENCKAVAPSLRQLEGAYGGDINFITVDGSDPNNGDLVGRFHVDGIPHLAFLDAKGTLQTSLIGAVPKPILKEQLDALANAKPLPYRGAMGDGTESPIDLEKGVCSLPGRYDM